MEKFWAFLKYYKNADKLDVRLQLQEYLKNFQTIEDFRVVEPEINEMLKRSNELCGENGGYKSMLQRHRSSSESDRTKVIERQNDNQIHNNAYLRNRLATGTNNHMASVMINSRYERNVGGNGTNNSGACSTVNQHRRTGSFGNNMNVRTRSGSLGNKPPQVVTGLPFNNKGAGRGSRSGSRGRGGGSGSDNAKIRISNSNLNDGEEDKNTIDILSSSVGSVTDLNSGMPPASTTTIVTANIMITPVALGNEQHCHQQQSAIASTPIETTIAKVSKRKVPASGNLSILSSSLARNHLTNISNKTTTTSTSSVLSKNSNSSSGNSSSSSSSSGTASTAVSK